MIYIIATMTIKSGSKDKLLELARPCIEASRQEAGGISYDLNQSLTNEDTLVFVERWESQAAIDNHFTEPHFRAWRQANADYVLDRKIEILSDATLKVL